MEFYTRYNPPESPHLRFELPSKTEQCHREDCDINTIINRYRKTGVLGDSASQVRDMVFGDFASMPDRLTSEIAVAEAKENFMKLPIDVRKHFDHDMGKLLKALNDPSQIPTLQNLGIVRKPDPVVGTPENPGDVSVVVKTDPAIQE